MRIGIVVRMRRRAPLFIAFLLPASVASAQPADAVHMLSWSGSRPLDVAMSPSSSIVILGTIDGLYVVDARTGQIRRETSGVVSDISLSLRGDRIAFVRQEAEGQPGALWTAELNAQSGAVGQLTRLSLRPAYSVAFSPDDSSIAFAANDSSRHRLIVIANGAERELAVFSHAIQPFWQSARRLMVRVSHPDKPDELVRVAIDGPTREPAGDGRRVQYVAGELTIRRSSPDAFLIARADGDSAIVRVPLDASLGAFSHADGRLTLFTGSRGATYIMDVVTGATRALAPFAASSRVPTWSPDGSLLAVQTNDSGRWGISIITADGKKVRSYHLPAEPINTQLLWSPDAKTIAYKSFGSRLWLLDVNSGKCEPLAHHLSSHHQAWRSDSKALFVAAITYPPGSPRIDLVELTTGGQERRLTDILTSYPEYEGRYRIGTGYYATRDWFVLVNPARLALSSTATLPPRRLPGPRSLLRASGSRNGEWLTFLVGDSSAGLRAIDFVRTNDGTSVGVDLPFAASLAGYHGAALNYDGSVAVLVGRFADDPRPRFFRVLRDQRRSEDLGLVPGDPGAGATTGGYGFELSPDGRSLAFAIDSQPIWHVFTISLLRIPD